MLHLILFMQSTKLTKINSHLNVKGIFFDQLKFLSF